MPQLFESVQIGSMVIANRIVMAPMTRSRCTVDHVPTSIMVDYYRQRAGAGLILSEGTGISLEGLGWAYAPGIWNEAQVHAWQPVTAAVHAQGGRIFCQLWHMGRVVHPSLPGRGQPVSSSATTMPGMLRTYDGKKPPVQAHALSQAEIRRVIDDYRRAAVNAIEAGFDGVQIHGANGYLVDQFLCDNTNFRTDEYGGSVNSRIRFLREVTAAVVEEVGAHRTAVRLSPRGERQGAEDSSPHVLFEAAAATLSALGIAFLEVRESSVSGAYGAAGQLPVAPLMRQAFQGKLVLNADFDFARAQAALDAGKADAVSFGRPFIANPDLPLRMKSGLPLAADDMDSWYVGGTKGYSDYAAHASVT